MSCLRITLEQFGNRLIDGEIQSIKGWKRTASEMAERAHADLEQPVNARLLVNGLTVAEYELNWDGAT